MNLNFKENLPDHCPLPDSIDVELTDVWRFLVGTTVANDSFDSYALQGKKCPDGVCECRWASCSLHEGEEHTAAMIKLPKFKRFKARAQLTIPAGSGRTIRNDRHIDFWAYDTFDFAASVGRVEVK